MSTAAHETLLVCFLGDPSGGSAELPQVVIMGADGQIENVALSPEPRRLIRLLALPLDVPLSGLTRRGSANRLAESLAAAAPQRTIREVEERLHCSRSQADRVRRGLQRELEAQQLDEHLHRPRGWIGLRNGTSDIALLFAAVRDERWDLANRLLTIVAPRDPLGAQLLVNEDWSPAARAHIADALTQAKRNSSPITLAAPGGQRSMPKSAPHPVVYEGEEVLDGEIVEDQAETVIFIGPREMTRWPNRRRRLRRGALVAALLLAAASTVTAAMVLLGPAPSPSPLQLSVKRAGPWPPLSNSVIGNSAALANLTREIPFGAPMAVRTGDTLLAAVRLVVARDSPWQEQPFEIFTSVEPSSPVEAAWSASFNGPNMSQSNSSGSVGILGLTARDRIRPVPHSTALLDDRMQLIRRLPDFDPDNGYERPYLVPRLEVGRLYYIVWRLQVVRAPNSAAGQISPNIALLCSRPGHDDSYNTEVALGEVLECRVDLTNWGPEALQDVRLHTSWSQANSRQMQIESWATAPNAEPRVARFVSEYLSIEPLWPIPGLEYISDSSQLKTRQGSLLFKPSGDPINGGIAIGQLQPGLTETRALAFKLRLVAGAGSRKS